jgi:hypothetical protein
MERFFPSSLCFILDSMSDLDLSGPVHGRKYLPCVCHVILFKVWLQEFAGRGFYRGGRWAWGVQRGRTQTRAAPETIARLFQTKARPQGKDGMASMGETLGSLQSGLLLGLFVSFQCSAPHD